MNQRKILSLLAIFFTGMATPAIAQNNSGSAPRAWVAHVEGMVCDFCAQGLLKALGKKDSVAEVEVSLEESTLTVHLKEDQQMSKEQLIKIIKDNGFTVGKIRSPNTKA